MTTPARLARTNCDASCASSDTHGSIDDAACAGGSNRATDATLDAAATRTSGSASRSRRTNAGDRSLRATSCWGTRRERECGGRVGYGVANGGYGPGLVNGALCNDCDLAAEDMEFIASGKASRHAEVWGAASTQQGCGEVGKHAEVWRAIRHAACVCMCGVCVCVVYVMQAVRAGEGGMLVAPRAQSALSSSCARPALADLHGWTDGRTEGGGEELRDANQWGPRKGRQGVGVPGGQTQATTDTSTTDNSGYGSYMWPMRARAGAAWLGGGSSAPRHWAGRGECG
eukprot:364295-Chlamydomonas_euryale.AAC.3